jgi:hypothetical protein
MRYVYNWLCWIDIGLNVLFGGDYRETCSSRLGRYYGKVKAATVIADAVNWVALHVFGQTDHCKVSIQPACDHTAEVWK